MVDSRASHIKTGLEFILDTQKPIFYFFLFYAGVSLYIHSFNRDKCYVLVDAVTALVVLAVLAVTITGPCLSYVLECVSTGGRYYNMHPAGGVSPTHPYIYTSERGSYIVYSFCLFSCLHPNNVDTRMTCLSLCSHQ